MVSLFIGVFNGIDLEAGDFFIVSGFVFIIVFDIDFSVVYSGFVFCYECFGMVLVVNFSYDIDMDCENIVNFNNELMYGECYEWDFGDGLSLEDEYLMYYFSIVGQYMVCFIVINDFVSLVYEEIINIVSVLFELDIDMFVEVLVNMFVNFSLVVVIVFVNFQWEFGLEDSSNLEDVMFMYIILGIYLVVFMVIDENGCMVMVICNIEIKLVDQVEGLNEDEEFIYYFNLIRGELMVYLEF